MAMNISPFRQNCGQIISGDTGTSLLQLDVSEIQKLFQASGFLLFRAFDTNLETFQAFVKRFTSQFLVDRGNSKTSEPSGGFVQSVTVGTKPIDLHCENAVSAERPDIIWFYCATPALRGGETTFCDGLEVWARLSDSIKQLFLTKKVKYKITVPREVYLNKEKEIVLPVGNLKFAGTTYRFNDDESLTIEYVVSAANKTKYGSRLAFANSITGPYSLYKITFEDNSEIPSAVMREIKQLHDKLTDEISWRPGELAMIDNSRFLHGRRAFYDKQRRIFTLMSVANF